MFPLHLSGLLRWIRTSVHGCGTGWCSAHAGCSEQHFCLLAHFFHKHFLGTCCVPGPCPLLWGREPWFSREADSSEGDSHMQLRIPQGDTPLCLECPPAPRAPCPHSELLLVFQVPAQKFIFFKQLTPPQARRSMAQCVLNANHALKKNRTLETNQKGRSMKQGDPSLLWELEADS